MAVVFVLHQNRVRRVQRRLELEQRASLSAERARIAADMHDELGAALTQITMLGEAAKGRLDDPHRTASTLDRMTAAAREVTANISELVWATNPRHDTLESLVAYLREHAARQFEPAAIAASFDFPQTIPALRVSAMLRRNTVMVVKEAINNLLKHSGAGKAGLTVEVTEAFLFIALVDDGRGFDPAKPRYTRSGMGNMRQRVEDMHGTLKVAAAPGAGTQIDIRIPIPRSGTRLPA